MWGSQPSDGFDQQTRRPRGKWIGAGIRYEKRAVATRGSHNATDDAVVHLQLVLCH